jgi:hypothetical protein
MGRPGKRLRSQVAAVCMPSVSEVLWPEEDECFGAVLLGALRVHDGFPPRRFAGDETCTS